MHTSDALHVSDRPLLEWLTIRGLRANLLVFGESISAERIAKYLMKWCPTPATLTVLPGELAMPPHRAGTWFLQGVDAMTDRQQRDLDGWLTGDGSGVQLVSIATTPLWPLVEKGQFLDRLYYRLNTIVLDARPADGRSIYDEGSGAPRS